MPSASRGLLPTNSTCGRRAGNETAGYARSIACSRHRRCRRWWQWQNSRWARACSPRN
jgi:hypothetical protein